MKNLCLAIILTNILSANKFDPSKLIKAAKTEKNLVTAIELYERAYLVRFPNKRVEDAVFKGFHETCRNLLDEKKFKQLRSTVEKAKLIGLPLPESFEQYLMKAGHDSGDYNLCIHHSTNILRKEQNHDQALFFRGKCRAKLKNYKKAIEDLTKLSSSFDPIGRRSALILLGEAYYHGGNFNTALDSLNKAQKMRSTEDIQAFINKVRNDQQLEEGYITSKPSPHFILRSTKDKQSELEERLFPILERSYRSLIQIFQFFTETPITVVVYDPKKRSMSVRLGNPSWAAGVYDGEIRIPYAETIKEEYKLETLLRHELVHLFTDVLTHNSIPTWFNEGIAQYYEKPYVYDGEGAFTNYIDAPIPDSFKEVISDAIKGNKLMPYERLAGSFSLFRKDTAILGYSQSLLMVKYLIEDHGIWRLRRMLRDIYQGNNFDVAFNTEFGYRPEDFLKGWIVHQKNEWKLP